MLVSYFFFLAPHILMLLVPLSILIGTLVTFGLLDKTGQITALKACGVSVYRVSLSVLGLTLLVGGFLYVLQEYVLPYANQRQDNLRTIIKGRPAQTFYQQGRNWIFGEGKRLYHYNYFDVQRGLFGDLSILDLDNPDRKLETSRLFPEGRLGPARRPLGPVPGLDPGPGTPGSKRFHSGSRAVTSN